MVDTTSIVLGSGQLYIAPLNVNGGIPEDLVSIGNHVGDISGGAELQYKPTVTEVENDFGITRKVFVTKEEVSLKSGILSWNLKNLEKLSVSGTYTENETTKTLRIGGKGSVTQYALAFVHSADFGKITVTLKGYSNSGFKFKFEKDKPTVVDTEFKAIADNNGMLVEITEEIV